MRVGIGYDVHPLRAGRDLILGGVRIDHPTGLDGHSDADVLTHAVIDAVIGAAGLGDIGTLFPATDPLFKDASSLDMLSSAMEAVRGAGYRVVNVDCTLIAQEPKISPYLKEMKINIGTALGLNPARVGIKATTNEHLGFIGREEGIAAMAVASVEIPAGNGS